MITFFVSWFVASVILTAITCRAIHNTKAQERAGINAEWKA